MTSNEAAAPGSDSTGGKAGSLPFDTSVAHQARAYDYMLGGKDNYAADRAVAEETLKIWPDLAFAARTNRAFLRRAVSYLAGEAGIRQFLDIGTGIPTAGNTHQVAQAIAPESRVVYVDYDPVVLAHARALLTSSTEAGVTEYIDADLRDTDKILTEAAQLLDFTKPVAVTLLLILHAIPDSDDPYAIVAKLMDAVPSGSYLAISHAGSDLLEGQTLQGIKDTWRGKLQQQITWRSHEQVERFFAATDLVEPGLVPTEHWRTDPATRDGRTAAGWAGVGRKRLCATRRCYRGRRYRAEAHRDRQDLDETLVAAGSVAKSCCGWRPPGIRRWQAARTGRLVSCPWRRTSRGGGRHGRCSRLPATRR